MDRSSGKILCGVCVGLARKFDLDPTLVRLLFVLGTLMGMGAPLIIYVILAVIAPGE